MSSSHIMLQASNECPVLYLWMCPIFNPKWPSLFCKLYFDWSGHWQDEFLKPYFKRPQGVQWLKDKKWGNKWAVQVPSCWVTSCEILHSWLTSKTINDRMGNWDTQSASTGYLMAIPRVILWSIERSNWKIIHLISVTHALNLTE